MYFSENPCRRLESQKVHGKFRLNISRPVSLEAWLFTSLYWRAEAIFVSFAWVVPWCKREKERKKARRKGQAKREIKTNKKRKKKKEENPFSFLAACCERRRSPSPLSRSAFVENKQKGEPFLCSLFSRPAVVHVTIDTKSGQCKKERENNNKHDRLFLD